MDLLLIPFSFLTVCLYLGLISFGNSGFVWIFSATVGIVLSWFWTENFGAKEKWELTKFLKEKINLFLIGMVLTVIVVTGFSVSPFVVTRKIDGFEHIQLTDVGDYYKHTFMVNQLAASGIPPRNPYFTKAKLSYYYGFYIVPSFIVKLTRLPGYMVTYWYSLLTSAFSLLLVAFLAARFIKRPIYRLLVMALVVTGVAVDTIPFVFNTHGQLQSEEGLQLINVYKSMLFAPQHFLAAALAVWTIYQVIYKKSSFWLVALFTSMVFLTSVFVSITLSVWLLFIFVFKKELRGVLMKSGVLTLILLIPYFLIFKERRNLLHQFALDPYNFSPYYLVNVFYTFYVKYGPFVFLTPLLLPLKPFRKLMFVGGYFVVLAMTWFIRSPIFNDFSMRTSIPVWLSLPVVVFAEADRFIKNRVAVWSLVIISVLAVGVGTKGLLLETVRHYRARQFLLPEESELIQKVRRLPENIRLSSIEDSKWVELMPSLANKEILSPYLFDSYAYFDREFAKERLDYEKHATEVFLDEAIGKDVDEVVTNKNQQLVRLAEFFLKYPADWLILSNRVFVKEGVNPWVALFRDLEVRQQPLTTYFSAFEVENLTRKLGGNSVKIEQKKITKLPLVDHGFTLEEGLRFLVACKDEEDGYVKLELTDYYSLFDSKLTDDEHCVGKLFYLSQTKRIGFNVNASLDNLYAAPLVTKTLAP